MEKMTEPIYRIQSLSCAIQGRTILDNISLHISKGEFLVIIGPNGAGKSTLLKHMVRVNKSPDNTIFLCEKCINSMSQRDIALKVGYVPQSSPVYLPFTAFQFVLMGRYPHMNPLVRPDSEQKTEAMNHLEKVGMGEFASRRVDMMSGGERQKIFIAAALAQQPDILLLDEPTTFLDPKHQSDIHKILDDLNTRNNLAVLAVTHDINFAARFSSRIVAVKKGSIVFDGKSSELVENRKLEELFDTGFEYIENEKEGKTYAFPRRK
ncbi:MAG TPA: ABC transporter ATP-binding protein [bacterium]|nr:ABC transporter ATP-binding protein [bacterium]